METLQECLKHCPRSALNDIAAQSRSPRVRDLACGLGIGHDDVVIRHIGASLREGLRRPAEINQLFVDHMMLALTAHVAQTYGKMRRITELPRGGLAPWQARQACTRLESNLSGKLSLQQIAAEFGLSVSHFFASISHLHRPAAAPMAASSAGDGGQADDDHPRSAVVRDCDVCRVCHQSHFTRVFTSVIGVSPGAWRREMLGAPESET